MTRFIQHFRKTLPHIARKNKDKYAVIQKRCFYPPLPPEDNNYMYYMFLIGLGAMYLSNNRRGSPPPPVIY
jgi:hypothetical protein